MHRFRQDDQQQHSWGMMNCVMWGFFAINCFLHKWIDMHYIMGVIIDCIYSFSFRRDAPLFLAGCVPLAVISRIEAHMIICA